MLVFLKNISTIIPKSFNYQSFKYILKTEMKFFKANFVNKLGECKTIANDIEMLRSLQSTARGLNCKYVKNYPVGESQISAPLKPKLF